MGEKNNALEKLQKVVAESPQFDDKDEAELRKMMDAYRSWVALGRVGKWLVLGLAAVTTLAVALGHLKTALKSFLQ